MENRKKTIARGLLLLTMGVALEGCGTVSGWVLRGGRPAPSVAFKFDIENSPCTGEANSSSDAQGRFNILIDDSCFGGRPRVKVHFYDGVRHTHQWVRNDTEQTKNLIASSGGFGG